MEPFMFGQVHQFDTLDISTRYFTSRYDDPLGQQIEFDPMVDPKGILASISNSKYFHGEDNKVLFYVLKPSGDEKASR
jgi:hypothetical protein